jgi:hypothetical protein
MRTLEGAATTIDTEERETDGALGASARAGALGADRSGNAGID